MTKTEQLRKELAEAFYNYVHRWGAMLCAFKDTPEYHKAIYYKQADKILATCKDAGLVFVVKDAKPDVVSDSSGCPLLWATSQANRMLKAGFRQTKEIELT